MSCDSYINAIQLVLVVLQEPPLANVSGNGNGKGREWFVNAISKSPMTMEIAMDIPESSNSSETTPSASCNPIRPNANVCKFKFKRKCTN